MKREAEVDGATLCPAYMTGRKKSRRGDAPAMRNVRRERGNAHGAVSFDSASNHIAALPYPHVASHAVPRRKKRVLIVFIACSSLLFPALDCVFGYSGVRGTGRSEIRRSDPPFSCISLARTREAPHVGINTRGAIILRPLRRIPQARAEHRRALRFPSRWSFRAE